MKKSFTELFLKKEWILYLISIVAAFILTVIVFGILNSRYDSKLNKKLLIKGQALNKYHYELATKYYHLTHGDLWTGSKEENNEAFIDTWKSISVEYKVTKEATFLKNIILYNNPNYQSFSKAKEGFLLPYLKNPSISINDIMSRLDWSHLETYFGKDGVDNVKLFFSQELSDQLDRIKSESTYTNRRYLNGGIQFLTFWVAFIGLLMLLSFMGSIKIEKESLQEAITSFDIPQNLDNYQIGQLEETLVRLREQLSVTKSKLLGMLINTISTFSWRGKEEAENTLSLEIQELREDMDSRFGMIKYFAWAVPSIGFIGTVVGIGKALGNAHNVIGQTAEFQTKGQIQLITGQLGIAFDTTLISLLLSIVLVLLIHILTRREEHLIATAVISVKKELLQKIAPLERANKLRRFNLLLESLKSHTSPSELQREPFVSLKRHLEDELNQNTN